MAILMLMLSRKALTYYFVEGEVELGLFPLSVLLLLTNNSPILKESSYNDSSQENETLRECYFSCKYVYTFLSLACSNVSGKTPIYQGTLGVLLQLIRRT